MANPQTPARDRYTPGLSNRREAVISEHFMHRLNNRDELALLSRADFSKHALQITASTFREQWLPVLIASAHRFAEQRAAAARCRARKNFAQYAVPDPGELTPAEIITEVLYDRQFLRSSRQNVSRATLARKIRALVERRAPIEMVIPSLPYKCTSPLKCRGAAPDLAEVGFLLSLFEMAKAVDTLYRDGVGDPGHSLSRFTVISDGRRFSDFLLEPSKHITDYQRELGGWVARLSIGEYVGVEDYAELLDRKLPSHAQAQKSQIRQQVLQRYREQMTDLLDPDDIATSLSRAIRNEPDPELFYEEGRFVPLLKSLVYTINYAAISEHLGEDDEHSHRLYAALTRQLFATIPAGSASRRGPGAGGEAESMTPPNARQARGQQSMRRQMLQQVWDATMSYLAEIRSDRDMAVDPVSGCFPDAIRWTIHAKQGQLAIQSNPSSGIHVQPWHGAGVLKRTKNNRIKLCALPCALLEKAGAIPILLGEDAFAKTGDSTATHGSRVRQPLFYVHPDLKVSTLADLLKRLPASFTRQRK